MIKRWWHKLKVVCNWLMERLWMAFAAVIICGALYGAIVHPVISMFKGDTYSSCSARAGCDPVDYSE